MSPRPGLEFRSARAVCVSSAMVPCNTPHHTSPHHTNSTPPTHPRIFCPPLWPTATSLTSWWPSPEPPRPPVNGLAGTQGKIMLHADRTGQDRTVQLPTSKLPPRLLAPLFPAPRIEPISPVSSLRHRSVVTVIADVASLS
jgi:hypothetical protein